MKRSESAPGIQRHQVYTTDGAAVTGTPGSWSLTAQERADIKKEVISEIAEITEGAHSFVPTLSAIDAAAGRSWASYARPLARPPPPQDTVWPPYEDRPGMTQVLAASHKRSSTLISSKAPRMLTGMGVYNGKDPRELLAQQRYSGYHYPVWPDMARDVPIYRSGVLQTSGEIGMSMSPGGAADMSPKPASGAEKHRARRNASYNSRDPKPGFAHVLAAQPSLATNHFHSKAPRLVQGQPVYQGQDPRALMADRAFTGKHDHIYQPPTNGGSRSLLEEQKAMSTAELVLESYGYVNRTEAHSTPAKAKAAMAAAVRAKPPSATLNDASKDGGHDGGGSPGRQMMSTDDGFRYGVVVRYPGKQHASFTSISPKVASNFPKHLEPYHRGRPGSELSSQSLQSFNTRPLSPAYGGY